MSNHASQISGQGRTIWGRRIISILLFGIGIGLGAASIWVYFRYASLATAENIDLSELPLPSLFMPEIDPQTGNYKTPIDEPPDALATRVIWRTSRIGGIGLILIVGGCAALVIPRHSADYRISTVEILGYVGTIACGVGFAEILLLPLVAATLGFGLGGRSAFWPSFGVGLVIEMVLLVAP